LSWARDKGYDFALAARDATSSSSAKARIFAGAPFKAAVSTMAREKGRRFVLVTGDAAAIGSAWTAANARAIARISLSAASTGRSWLRAGAKNFAHKLHRAGMTASPWLRATTHRTVDGLLMLTVAARRMAERQGEQTSLFVLRLSAQAKGEFDALRRAIRAGELTPPVWCKFTAVVSSRKDEINSVGKGDDVIEAKDFVETPAEYAIFETRDHTSRNALVCVEPWRCRLPVIHTGCQTGRVATQG
jgi:hypothetical protein